MNWDLEIRRAVPEMDAQIADFFKTLEEALDIDFFRPHQFTPEQAGVVANYQGKDFYAFTFRHSKIIGYGMLRGWDEGYDIPSLGICIHPEFRGAGIGHLLMHYLHVVAALRGCSRIRLRVKKENHRARRLYEKLGYQFEEHNEHYDVGFLNLNQHH